MIDVSKQKFHCYVLYFAGVSSLLNSVSVL